MDQGSRHTFLAVCLLAGVGFLLYYTAVLHKEDLKTWQRVEVYFEDVAGLEQDDEVRVHGAKVGRVSEIHTDPTQERQRVVLEIETWLKLFSKDYAVEIVPTSALGFVAIEINQGDPRSPPLDLGPDHPPLAGRIRPALGGSGPPSPNRRKELREWVEDMEKYTADLKDPDKSGIGGLAFDRLRLEEFREQLKSFELLWEDVDAGLARIENGELSPDLLSPESLEGLSDVARALHTTLSNMRDGLKSAVEGDGSIPAFVMDRAVGEDLKKTLASHRRFWRATRTGDGLLGQLTASDAQLHDALSNVVDNLEGASEAGIHGEGLLGVLSSERSGEAARETLRGMEASLDRARTSPLVRDPEAKFGVYDGLGGLDDALNDLRRGLKGFRANFDDKTFQGAVFAVF